MFAAATADAYDVAATAKLPLPKPTIQHSTIQYSTTLYKYKTEQYNIKQIKHNMKDSPGFGDPWPTGVRRPLADEDKHKATHIHIYIYIYINNNKHNIIHKLLKQETYETYGTTNGYARAKTNMDEHNPLRA